MATTENINSKIIGRGVLFPIQLTTNAEGKTGWYPVEGSKALIVNNVNAILLYMLGERFRQEDFGSRLWECIEEPNTQAQAFLINTFLKEALSTWEDRIIYDHSEVTREASKVHIRLFYKLVQLGQTSSLDITYDNLTNTLT